MTDKKLHNKQQGGNVRATSKELSNKVKIGVTFALAVAVILVLFFAIN